MSSGHSSPNLGLSQRKNRKDKSDSSVGSNNSQRNNGRRGSKSSLGSKGSAGGEKDNTGSKGSSRSLSPPRPRRDLWGKNRISRRFSRASDQSIRSLNSAASEDPSAAGQSRMYPLLNSEFEDNIPNEAVKKVLKLMLSSIAVVFQETVFVTDQTEGPFRYTRIPSIPAPAARMLWNELMGGVTTEVGPEGTWHIDFQRKRPPDPALSRDMIEQFALFVNGRRSAIQRKQKEKGFLAKVRKNKANNEVDKPTVLRRNSKDPFLLFIRDTLVELGFLELAGRRIDDEEEDPVDDEDDGSSSTVDEMENDLDDDESFGNDLEDSSNVDFTGWAKRKKKIRSQPKPTQFFQIYKDMQFQYGVYLSGQLLEDGGFAVVSPSRDFDLVFTREQTTMRRWNDAMSNACSRELKDAQVIDKRGGDTSNVEWSRKRNPFSDAASYAIQMYPSHLMRAGRVVEAARIMMNPKFFLARVISLEPYEAADRHLANMREMERRSDLSSGGRSDLGGDGNSINPKDITLATISVMVKTLKERHPILGEEDSDRGQKVKAETEAGEVGRALHLIAAFLGEKRQLKSSMETYELCLKYKTAALGGDHSSVGRTWRYMGHQYMESYEYEDAIDAYSEAIRIERLQTEVEFKHVIVALNSMAMIYGMSRRPKQAIDCYSESLVIQRAQFGDNLQVAETLNSMGIVYGMMCEFESAITCYSEALFIKIRKLGKDNEEVADVYFNLGLVHNKNGNHEGAINDYQEALRIRKDQLGEEHEEVAQVLHHIGVVLSEMGEVGDSQRFYEECLRIRRLTLGDEHEEVARTLHNLGLVYYDSGNYDMALECLEDALELGKKKVGKRKEKVADTLHAIGLVYQKLANFKESIHNYEEAVKIRRDRLGESHLDVASTFHNMGDVYYMMGDLGLAMETYEEAYEIRLDRLGSDHVDVAATRNNMGVVLMKQGEHGTAMDCFTAALKVREERLGPDHEKCSDTLHNMGLVHKNLKQYTEATARYEQALRVRRIQLGENDMKVADTLYNMAIVYANTGQYAKALERYKEALRTYRETGMSDDHPSVVNTLQWIKWGQKKLNKARRREMQD